MIGNSRHETPPQALLDNRSDPFLRAVLSDWYLDRGLHAAPIGVALGMIADAATDATSAADAATDADADATDAADASAADADATSAADAATDADADATDAAEAAKNITSMLCGSNEMKTGLTVLQITGAYYGYAVTVVGWLRQIGGDEYEMLPGHVTVLRTGQRYPNGLDRLAVDGPGQHYQCSEPTKGAELFHRLLVRRVKPANEKAWASICPRPKDWRDE